MAAIDIRSLNPSQLPGAPTDGSTDAVSASVAQTPAAAHLEAARQLLAVDGLSDTKGAHTVGQAGAVPSNAPSLPDPAGTKATPQAASMLLASTTMYDANLAGPISSAEAFNILQKSAANGYQLSSVINRAANMTAIDAKKSEANNMMKQVLGEREHAAVAFGAAVAGAVAGVVVPIYGSKLGKGSSIPDAKVGTPPATPAAGAPSAASAASNLAKPKVDAVTATSKNKLDLNGKALDPNAPSSVPGATAKDANNMAARQKIRDAKAKNAQNTAQGGPSSQPANASAPQAQTTPAGNPGGGGTNNGTTQADDKLPGLTEKEQGRIERGQALTQAGQSFSAVITSGADMVDKTSATGGQYQADVARIAQKQDAIDGLVADVAKDSSKSSQEQALETLKAAQNLVQSFSQRWTEVANNIANR